MGSCPVRNTGSDRLPGGPLRWDGSQKYGQGLLEFGEGGEAPSYAASECMICWLSPPAYEARHGLRSAQRHFDMEGGSEEMRVRFCPMAMAGGPCLSGLIYG